MQITRHCIYRSTQHQNRVFSAMLFVAQVLSIVEAFFETKKADVVMQMRPESKHRTTKRFTNFVIDGSKSVLKKSNIFAQNVSER